MVLRTALMAMERHGGLIAAQIAELDALLFEPLLELGPMLAEVAKIAVLQNGLGFDGIAALAQFQGQLGAGAGFEDDLQGIRRAVIQPQRMEGNHVMCPLKGARLDIG